MRPRLAFALAFFGTIVGAPRVGGTPPYAPQYFASAYFCDACPRPKVSLAIELYWTSMADDLDLHIRTPSGEEISFVQPQSKAGSSGGLLDIDCRFDTQCSRETFYVTATPPGASDSAAGVYHVWIEPYELRDRGRWELTVTYFEQIKLRRVGDYETSTDGWLVDIVLPLSNDMAETRRQLEHHDLLQPHEAEK